MLRRGITLLATTACVALMAAWFGGFAVYAGVVVPILHDEFGTIDGSLVTRRVTVGLNVLGVAALVSWSFWTALAWSRSTARIRWVRLGCLLLSGVCLVALVSMHGLMERMLETTGTKGFYPWHRGYLILSTIQWFANLGALGTALDVPSLGRDDRRGPDVADARSSRGESNHQATSESLR